MECEIFHLDALKATQVILSEHLAGTGVRKHLWSRVASPIQITIITVENIVTQTLRGIALTITGIISLNKKAFTAGILDIVCMIIQTVALPFIALASFFSPKHANKYAKDIQGKLQVEENSYCYLKGHPFTGRVSALVFGVLSVPSSIIKCALEAPVHFLRLRPDDTISCLFLIIKEPLVNLTIALLSVGPGSARDRVFYSMRKDYLYARSPTKELSIWNFDVIHNQHRVF